jgi:hypothetical protein
MRSKSVQINQHTACPSWEEMHEERLKTLKKIKQNVDEITKRLEKDT